MAGCNLCTLSFQTRILPGKGSFHLLGCGYSQICSVMVLGVPEGRLGLRLPQTVKSALDGKELTSLPRVAPVLARASKTL